MQKYKDKSLRLPSWNYSANGFYFLTLCTHNRHHSLGEIINGQLQKTKAAILVENCWLSLNGHYGNCYLDEFIIMPNHLHGLIFIEQEETSELAHQLTTQRRSMLIPKMVGRFKMQSTKLINEAQKTPGKKFWQSDYYDRVVRNEDELNNIREYIHDNPMAWEYDRFNSQRIRSTE
ncbi:MAG TPA: transposase, partial [Coxiellaceae bacterium]|nr:transposase [Coxiellaceae bacterium]